MARGRPFQRRSARPWAAGACAHPPLASAGARTCHDLGDSRGSPCFSEEIRVKDVDLGAACDDALEADELLGRLKTTTAFPTTASTATDVALT